MPAMLGWGCLCLVGAGWKLTPTNGSTPSERYLNLGWGRGYADVTPLKGVMNGCGEHDLHVEVDVLSI